MRLHVYASSTISVNVLLFTQKLANRRKCNYWAHYTSRGLTTATHEHSQMHSDASRCVRMLPGII